MRKTKKDKSILNLILLTSCQKSINDLDELVHHGHHGLSVAEAFAYLLGVVVIKDRVVGNAPLGHEETVLSEAAVAMLGYMARGKMLSGLVDGRIRADVCDELLVGGEPADIIYLSHEVGSSDITDAREGSEDLNLLCMYLLLMSYESFRESLVPLLEVCNLFGTVLDEVSAAADSNAASSKLLYGLDGMLKASASLDAESGKELLISSGKDFRRRTERGKEFDHGCGKYIQGKDFRPCCGKVALELGLGSGDILCNLLPSSCYASYFLVHPCLLPGKCIVIDTGVSGNAESIRAVGLCASEGIRLDELVDEERVCNTYAAASGNKEAPERKMVSPGGFHDEERVPVHCGEEGFKAASAHIEMPLAYALPFFADDMEVELPACDVNAYDLMHDGTSWVNKDGSPYPFSRMKEALGLNQPIGIERELGQTPSEARSLKRMSSSVPSNISNLSLFYRYYC